MNIVSRVGIQLAVVVDLDSIEEEAINSVARYISQSMYIQMMAGKYRTYPCLTRGAFHEAVWDLFASSSR